MNLLHLDSSILGDHSVSRHLSASIVARLRQITPDATVIYRDLAAEPLTHLSGATLFAAQNPQGDHAPAIQADLAAGAEIMAQFQAADTLVIGVPLYNFGVPSQLKAWIDRIVIKDQTFRYTADGRPEGLAGGKRAFLAVARGGFYGPGAPAAAFEHTETYMRTVLGFIGITDLQIFVAEGIATGPDQRAAAIEAAERQIAAIG